MKRVASTPRTDVQLIAALGARDYPTYTGAEEELRSWFEAHPGEAALRAKRLAALALSERHATARARVGSECLPVIARALGGRETLPAAYDSLVTAQGEPEPLRFVLGKIPIDRRTAILVREINSGREDAMPRVAWLLLDLAPEALYAIFDHPDFKDCPHVILGWSNVTHWCKKVPRIAAMLRAFEKKIGPLPKAEPKRGPFRFEKPMVVGAEHYPRLDDVAKAQYRAAAAGYIGGSVRDATHFIQRLKGDDNVAGDATMVRWQVSRDGAHAYDLWVVCVDNGSVFPAGKKMPAPAYLVQGGFAARDKKQASRTLAADLDASAPEDLWSTPKPRRKRR